jgi:hypothetical protein
VPKISIGVKIDKANSALGKFVSFSTCGTVSKLGFANTIGYRCDNERKNS